MPRSSPRKPGSHKVTKRELNRLKELDDESLAILWTRARNTLFQRRRERKGLKASQVPYSEVVVIQAQAPILARLNEWTKGGRRTGIGELDTIACTGRCSYCPFGVEDLDKGWRCIPREMGVEVININDPKRIVSIRKRVKKTSNRQGDSG